MKKREEEEKEKGWKRWRAERVGWHMCALRGARFVMAMAGEMLMMEDWKREK